MNGDLNRKKDAYTTVVDVAGTAGLLDSNSIFANVLSAKVRQPD